MDIFTAIRERRSCRSFLPDPISDEVMEKILEAAVWAPSAANNQPWEFIIITNKSVKKDISSESEKCRKILFEKSGWKWVDKYRINFLEEAPVIIAVIGDPRKTGADMFLEGGGLAYRDGCAAAIQNLLLAAHALELRGGDVDPQMVAAALVDHLDGRPRQGTLDQLLDVVDEHSARDSRS